MIPVRLSLSGFLSYREPVELDFTLFEVACISGSNGAGKSSLLDAITFALFGQARKRDESLINAKSETAEVVFTFDYEGNTYRVQRAKPRGKTTLLEFYILGAGDQWKALTERTMRDTEILIERTLRLDYETFVNASFFLQGKADQFTQQRPADRKRILGSILGLEVWEQYRSATFEQRRTVEQGMREMDGRLQEINVELAEETTRKARLKELQTILEQQSKARTAQESVLEEMRGRVAVVEQQAELVNTLQAQLARSEASVEALRVRLEERQREQGEFSDLISRAPTIIESFEKLQTQRQALIEWEQIAGRFNEQEKRRSGPLTAIETERARLETGLDSLKAERARFDEVNAEKPKLETDLEAAKKALDAAEGQVNEREKSQADLDEARKGQAKAQAENPLLREEMEQIQKRIQEIQKAKGASCPTCGQALTDEHRAEMVTLWSAEGKEKGDLYRANQAAVKESDSKVAEVEKRIAQLSGAEAELRQQAQIVDQLENRLVELAKVDATWDKQQGPRLVDIEKTLSKEAFAIEARAELAKIDDQLKEIGYDAAKHDALRKEEELGRVAEAEMNLLEQAQAALKPLAREIRELEGQIEEQGKELKGLRKTQEDVAASLEAAQTSLPDIVGAQREMLNAQEQENIIRQEVGAAQQRVAVLNELQARKKDISAAREEQGARAGQLQALERAFGKDGVPAMLIEQALPQIEIKANEILERLSGGSMHINFLTQQAYKDKTREDLRETLEIQISDSVGERDYEMFSGGEAFRINFAIRLALSEVLAQRAGARLQTLVIDEGFGSQDEAGRQRLVEAINLVKADFAKILVITHIDALKDAFPTRIEVEKTREHGSVLQVI
ncbi:MAG: SMC family ATPase [Chloroflexi bacterium]|nr:SMC family ATPase [Chloroflexota bacterium]MQC26165.1 SMC family ATPase [Chloroflexota bacterium]